jgi:hypothetical protein
MHLSLKTGFLKFERMGGMKTFWTASAVFACLLSLQPVIPAESAGADTNMVIRILFENRDDAYARLKPLWLTYENVSETWAQALVTQNELIKIRDLGFDVEILWEDARDRAQFYRESMGDRWTSYSALVSDMQALAADYPDIVRIQTIGETVQGRSIWVMKITDQPDENETDEPEVRMIGNIHGDEYISMEIMRLLMVYLTENYGVDPTVTELVNTREIWIQPSVNPDGHELGTRSNANGVDMNRNHGYMYYSSGSGPFSEPELQHFREWSLLRNFSTSLTFHGVTRYYNYTWNFTGQNCPDKTMLDDWGDVYTVDNGYTVIEGYDWYQTNGDTNDWSYGCRGSLDVTIETPGSASQHIQQDFDDNIDGILYFIEVAGYGISGVVTDAVTGEPLEAVITVHQHPMMVYSDPEAGDYHRPLQAGTYTLTAWANGYNPLTLTGITVADQSTTIRDIQLYPSYTHHALHVAWTQITSYYRNNADSWPAYMWPHNALGPPDDVPASIGQGCTFAFDMGEGFEIADNPGMDFVVHEADSAGDGDERCYVYGSSGGFLGPWVLIGIADGTTEFDLAGTGLASIRYLRLVDYGDGTAGGSYPGYDLDAISVVQIPEGCGIVCMDATQYLCEMEPVTITLIDSDLNTNPGIAESHEVFIYSDSDPAGEFVMCHEVSPDSDTFTGTVLLDYAGGSGVLMVQRGDLVTVVYEDADCEGSPATATDTATAVCILPAQIYFWDMNTDPGWTTEAMWEWGVASGTGGNPSSGYTGDTIYGYNLSGSYTNNMPERTLTTQAIDCTDLENVEVRYRRWLGIESSQYDHAAFRVSNNGSIWTTVWEHSDATFTDTEWQQAAFDISSIADNQPSLYLRWVMGTTDGSVIYCGWNIDDVEIWAEDLTVIPPTPTQNPCINNGDVNDDGVITAGDAQLAFQIALGMIIPTYEEACAADCNGDDQVTAGDAQMIFLAALGSASCVDPI